ncbi:MAG: ABC transporter ATP-binding protein [Planctomycetota bacterium]|nr:ABC transporter ATP-binding protein [Planctomycetota bacterium]
MGRKNKKKSKRNSKRQNKASERAPQVAPKAPETPKANVADSSPAAEAPKETAKAAAPAAPTSKAETLLEVRGLKTWFYTDEGIVKAVNGVNLKIGKGETLGIVGESACGKSVTAFSIMRLIPNPPGKIVGGQILFEGKDIVQLDEPGMREIRGNDIAMIFQEPMTSLNPVYTVGDQIAEVVMLHQKLSKKAAWKVAEEMLEKVGIPEPAKRVSNYPHEMSGGMKQRVMIAMALACKPKLLIADEPTTALDVTIQAQILDLMRRLQEDIGMSIWFITHDLGVIAEIAHQVAVMYASRVVEHTDVNELFENPRHPYTRGLFQSLPHLDADQDRLTVIPGAVPNPLNHPSGCRFHTRCEFVIDDCKTTEPELVEISPGHQVACLRVERGETLFEV